MGPVCSYHHTWLRYANIPANHAQETPCFKSVTKLLHFTPYSRLISLTHQSDIQTPFWRGSSKASLTKSQPVTHRKWPRSPGLCLCILFCFVRVVQRVWTLKWAIRLGVFVVRSFWLDPLQVRNCELLYGRSKRKEWKLPAGSPSSSMWPRKRIKPTAVRSTTVRFLKQLQWREELEVKGL